MKSDLGGLSPPLQPAHGAGLRQDDGLVPFQQSVQLAGERTRRATPHESHTYEGLKHSSSISVGNATPH